MCGKGVVAGLLAIAVSYLGLAWFVAAEPPDRPAPEKPALAAKDFGDAKFRKFVAAADALAKPGWKVVPLHSSTYRGGPARYVAQWCERANPKGECSCTSREPIPNHTIQISCDALNAGAALSGVHLYAGYIPKQGWGARIEYNTHNGLAPLGEHFRLFFFHPDHNRERHSGQGKWALELGNSYFTTTKRHGDHAYHFQVSMYGDPKTWMGDTRTPRDKDVARYLTSAEGLRDAGLAELDALEGHARKQIPTGAAILKVYSHELVRSDYPPKEVPLTPKIELPKQQLAKVLDEALADIHQRRKLVREHYREMFAAARVAFPLRECLNGKP